MRYIGVKEAATKWNISERSVRNYCTNGRIPGAVLDGKTWDIPEDAVKPQRKKRTEKIETDLLSRLRMEKESGISGGIYHKIQIELTYNSNHIEGSRLIIEQAHYKLSEAFIKQLHAILKSGTSDSRKSWFAVGDYKRFANEVGGSVTTKPEQVAKEMRQLLKQYNADSAKTLEDIIEFHYMFEKIHPFQDGKVTLRYQQNVA